MALAIFDLDNTLLNGDSDHSWNDFLADHGYIDAALCKQINDKFYNDYLSGNFDIHAYLSFSLEFLIGKSKADLAPLHALFMQERVKPMMQAKAQALVEKHRQAGDTLLIITATNRFVTEPIAKAHGIEHLIASEPEYLNGHYTGKVVGTPSFHAGKITRLHEWLAANPIDLSGSYFYSDSHNDIPLLQLVEHPFVVDGDDTLIATGNAHDWAIISLRD